MRLTPKMIELSKKNKESQYFFFRGDNYLITKIDIEKNVYCLKNIDTGEFVRMETTDKTMGDLKNIKMEVVNNIKANG